MNRPVRIPRHVQISNALRRQIDERELLPGDLLPSEADLCGSFKVSRSVIRQALDTLVRDGVVKKAHGRGTVVSVGPELQRNPLWSAGLSTQMAKLGSRVSTRVLSYEIEDVPTSIRGLAGPQALRLERLRFVDDQPTAFIRTWLPCELSALITPDILENASLHEQLYLKAGWVVSTGNRQVRATAARAPIDGLLDVPAGYPLLLLEGQSTEQHGRVVEVFSTWHRSDRIAFDISENPQNNPVMSGNGDTPEIRKALENAQSLMENALAEIAKLTARPGIR
ncbi:MAG: GntR family transcriptional regulator [Candidatus Accumulibacter sp.]|nr:GntR family transcriptional regulator [Accumulibacter sp.]